MTSFDAMPFVVVVVVMAVTARGKTKACSYVVTFIVSGEYEERSGLGKLESNNAC